MTSDTVEFVVLGRFGPYLRSMLADLEIEDRAAESVLVLREPDQVSLLSKLATVIGQGREVQSIRCLGVQLTTAKTCGVLASSPRPAEQKI